MWFHPQIHTPTSSPTCKEFGRSCESLIMLLKLLERNFRRQMWHLAPPCVSFLYKSRTTHSVFPCTHHMDEKVTSYQITILLFFQYWLWCKVTQPTPVPQMAITSTGNRNVKNLPLDSDGKRPWSFGMLSCFGDCGTCKYPESPRRYPFTEFQAAVHAGVPVFYTGEIGGALIILIHKATRILVAMKLSLQTLTVGSTLSLKLFAKRVGSYRWEFLFHPHAFPILFFLHPTECSDDHFPRRLALEGTFVNGMASEAAILVTLVRVAVAQDAI